MSAFRVDYGARAAYAGDVGADFTLIDDGTEHRVDAEIRGERVLLSADAVRNALGWDLKPQGLCRGDVCVPVRDASLKRGAGIDLAILAEHLDRPLALELPIAAYVGASASTRGDQLASLEAPDFTLPDLDGKPHSLSDYRGRKVLLVAYASW